jgi:hypothetical protein
MKDAFEALQKLQQKIIKQNDFNYFDNDFDNDYERLLLMEINNVLHIEFYGNAMGDFFYELQEIVCNPIVSPYISFIAFHGSDDGANGTTNWDFTSLIDSNAVFLNLSSFFVETYQPERHNCPIIAYSLEEEGMIAKMVSKMPRLQFLTVPSAPDISFFEIGKFPLKYLRLDAGYDHQDFILNLSKSNCFPDLEVLDYCEYSEQYLVDKYTPIEDFVDLFKSKAFSNVYNFVLRNPSFSLKECKELSRLRENLTFRLVWSSCGEYI